MKEKFHLFLILSILLCGINSGKVKATDGNQRLLEEIYPEIGYKTVEEAVREFEQHYNRDLKLPLRVPPLEFSHRFGRFNDLEGDINDSLEIKLIDEKSAENHYKIDVRPFMHKIPFRAKTVFKLKDGSDAAYTNVTGFNLFIFERDGWQYILSIDKRGSEKVTPEVFVKIANSIDYPVEIKNR